MDLQDLITTDTLMTLFATTLMAFDDYHADFARMLYLIRQTMSSRRRKKLSALPVHSGILASLFYICLKCCDLPIRCQGGATSDAVGSIRARSLA
jgi:hypothetical protein